MDGLDRQRLWSGCSLEPSRGVRTARGSDVTTVVGTADLRALSAQKVEAQPAGGGHLWSLLLETGDDARGSAGRRGSGGFGWFVFAHVA